MGVSAAAAGQRADLICCDHFLLIDSKHVIHVIHSGGFLQHLPLFIILLFVNDLQQEAMFLCERTGQTAQIQSSATMWSWIRHCVQQGLRSLMYT